MIHRSFYLLVVALCFFASLPTSSGIPVRISRRTDDSDDNCAHPFHSFLCNKAPRARINVPQPSITRVVSVPAKQPPPELPLSGENSFLDPTFIAPTTTTTTTSTTTKPSPPVLAGDSSIGDPVFVRPNPPPPPPRFRPLEAQAAVASEVRTPPKDSSDLCAHSFHSFLCQPGRKGSRRIITGKMPTSLKGDNSFLDPVRIKTTKAPPPSPEPEIPDASFQSPNFYKPDPVTTLKPRTTTTPRPTTTTPRPTTTTSRPTTRYTTTPRAKTTTPQQPEIPDASIDSPSFIKPEPPRTTQPPRTTVKVLVAAPQQVVKVTAQPEHYKGENPCNHAFHSYLCQPGRSSRRRNYGQAPVQPSASNQQPILARPKTTTTRAPEVPESSQLLAVALPPATTRKPPPPTTRRPPPPTTTRKPPPPPTTTPPPPPIEAAPSSNNFAGILPPKPKPKPILEAAANAPSSRVEQYDKCKHAFHSFLCQPARPRKNQIQPAPSNVESSVLLPDFRKTTPPPTPPPTRPPPPPTRPPTTRPPPTPEEPVQVPDSSFNDPQRLAPPAKRDPPPPPALEPAPSSLQNELLPAQFVRAPSESTSDVCTHSFHCFLFKKAPRARRPIRIN